MWTTGLPQKILMQKPKDYALFHVMPVLVMEKISLKWLHICWSKAKYGLTTMFPRLQTLFIKVEFVRRKLSCANITNLTPTWILAYRLQNVLVCCRRLITGLE